MLRMNRIAVKASLILALLALVALFLAVPNRLVFADSTGVPGQPSQSCQVSLVTPGNAANAPGSAFNPTGVAGGVYAGTQPQNSVNPVSVSQYDVACFQQASH